MTQFGEMLEALITIRKSLEEITDLLLRIEDRIKYRPSEPSLTVDWRQAAPEIMPDSPAYDRWNRKRRS